MEQLPTVGPVVSQVIRLLIADPIVLRTTNKIRVFVRAGEPVRPVGGRSYSGTAERSLYASSDENAGSYRALLPLHRGIYIPKEKHK